MLLQGEIAEKCRTVSLDWQTSVVFKKGDWRVGKTLLSLPEKIFPGLLE